MPLDPEEFEAELEGLPEEDEFKQYYASLIVSDSGYDLNISKLVGEELELIDHLEAGDLSIVAEKLKTYEPVSIEIDHETGGAIGRIADDGYQIMWKESSLVFDLLRLLNATRS